MIASTRSLALQPRGSAPPTRHQHVPGLLGQQRLGGEHVLDFAGADAVRQRAEGAVRRGVGVAADDRHARQRRALLRADHVDDALAKVVHLELGDAVAVAVAVQRVDLQARDRVRDAVGAIGRRYVVVTHRQVGRQSPDLAAGQVQALEGLRARHLVHQVPVDVEDSRPVVFGVDDVLVPDLVVQRAAHGAFRRSESEPAILGARRASSGEGAAQSPARHGAHKKKGARPRSRPWWDGSPRGDPDITSRCP
jgi:hypothetical protein